MRNKALLRSKAWVSSLGRRNVSDEIEMKYEEPKRGSTATSFMSLSHMICFRTGWRYSKLHFQTPEDYTYASSAKHLMIAHQKRQCLVWTKDFLVYLEESWRKSWISTSPFSQSSSPSTTLQTIKIHSSKSADCASLGSQVAERLQNSTVQTAAHWREASSQGCSLMTSVLMAWTDNEIRSLLSLGKQTMPVIFL